MPFTQPWSTATRKAAPYQFTELPQKNSKRQAAGLLAFSPTWGAPARAGQRPANLDGLCALAFFLRREACFGKPSTHHATHRSPQENLYGARSCPHGLCGAQPFTHTAAEIKPPLCSFYLIQGTRGAAITRKAASLLMNRAPSITMAEKVL